MTNAAVVILGVVVGLLGAVLAVWPSLIISEKEITRQKMGQVWWLDEKYAKKERRYTRLGVVVMMAGASLQAIGALIL